MRLYARLSDVGSEYYTLAPTELSLKPFKGCYFIDIPENKHVKHIVADEGEDCIWTLYNGVDKKHVFYSYSEQKIDDNEELDDSVEGDWCQKYENGIAIGEPYFEPD